MRSSTSTMIRSVSKLIGARPMTCQGKSFAKNQGLMQQANGALGIDA